MPLNADVRRAIATYVHEERQGADPGAFLFISQRTKSRLTEKAVRELAAKYGYHAMVEDAHPHAFRHSFASELLRRGCRSRPSGRCWGTSPSNRRHAIPSPPRKTSAMRCRSWRSRTSGKSRWTETGMGVGGESRRHRAL